MWNLWLLDLLRNKNEKRYNKLLSDFDSEKQKCAEYKAQKKELKQEVEDLKNERTSIYFRTNRRIC